MANTLMRIASYIGGWMGGQRSLENPSTSLSNPDDWLFESFGSETTASGSRVNAEIALKYAPALMVCATVPLTVQLYGLNSRLASLGATCMATSVRSERWYSATVDGSYWGNSAVGTT